MSSLHQVVGELLRSASVIGIGGSREPGMATQAVVQQIRQLLPDGVRLHVGDARGVDAMIRWAFAQDRCTTHLVRDYGPPGAPYAYAKRSVAVVDQINVPGGVWMSFPDRPCPAGLAPAPEPRAVFIGTGNGSWSTLAYAIGLGRRDRHVRSLLYLPPDHQPPEGWSLQPLGGLAGWWLASPLHE